MLRTNEVCKRYHVTEGYLRKWRKKGWLVPTQERKHGHRYYSEAQCELFFSMTLKDFFRLQADVDVLAMSVDDVQRWLDSL